MSDGIVVEGVSYRYRRGSEVLADVRWRPGRRAALLGPNGAGKSTLFAVVSGATTPRRGRVLIDGAPVRPGKVAWMPQGVEALPSLRCREQVALAGWLQGLTRHVAWRAALDALDAVGLGDRADHRASTLSGGQLRRVGIAEALVARPRVVLLDEPTVGLDPLQRDQIRSLLVGLGERCQILVATHLVDDLATSFDTVTVLAGGVIRFDGPVDAFVALAPSDGTFAERATAAYAVAVGARA